MNKCEGCKSYRYYPSRQIFECRLTVAGDKTLNNCPCWNCIIKVICENGCPAYNEILNLYWKNKEKIQKTVRLRWLGKNSNILP